MYDMEKVREYALEQEDWIAHRNGRFQLKECVFFYHKGQPVFNPWRDISGNFVDDPFAVYGKDKVNEYCRRMTVKKADSSAAKMISVDTKILDFLKLLYFGVTDNPFEAASRSAYTDMCRTIRFNGKNGDQIRARVNRLLEEQIPALSMVDSSEDFIKWHYSVCAEIVELYQADGIEFYIGQAQKWVNMTLKYLYVLVPDVVEPFYSLLHIPLDNYIMDIAKEQYGVPSLPCAWSRISDYQVYLEYEEKLMEVIDEVPLDWEFEKWVESARRQKSEKSK